MNIQRITALAAALLMSISIFSVARNAANFVTHQDIQQIENSEDIYDFSNKYYLIKNEIRLCDKTYTAGEMITKAEYARCSNN